ncbi:MAG: 1-deoxy-D-xylulose-5-phosphate reductoisomerase [Solobacterium sp.]|nr:1-deoxy-D-xylulose-5-phosphate reductoisomerase [Solobacterium sp.]
MKRIVLLGASGSIGLQTMDVVEQHPDEFEVVGLSVGQNIPALRQILRKHNIYTVCVQNKEDLPNLQEQYPDITFLYGDEGLEKLVTIEDYDILVNALVGFVGLYPTYKAIETGHDIALANKETLVVGGDLIMPLAKEKKVHIYPIDSEHSAIFQCLQGNHHKDIKRLIITASGGSFRTKTREELEHVTVKEALQHPNWTMGAKITIDSATMMNKGFEVIEAHHLFDIPYEQISVLMHDESIIHSMVEFQDHAILAQLGTPDMRIPIQYALTWPDRYPIHVGEPLDLAKVQTLHFHDADFKRYPLLALAYEVGRRKGNLPAVMNGANEEANQAFREGKIKFLQIEDAVYNAVYQVGFNEVHTIDDLKKADQAARQYVKVFIEDLKEANE